jgi:hypothetical protein
MDVILNPETVFNPSGFGGLSAFEEAAVKDFKHRTPEQIDKENTATKKRIDMAHARSKILRAAQTNIAPVPDIEDIQRRESTKFDFRLFNEVYFSIRFNLRWSSEHLGLIDTMESAVLRGGGMFAFAFPRGSGKSSLSETLALWALLHAHKRFVVPIGATASHATEMFQSITGELETNHLLYSDFPEVCYPIVKIGGNYAKAKAQHIDGRLTRIKFSTAMLVFPDVEGSLSSGSCVQVASITGRLRGIKRVTPSGEVLRPDFVIIDDPQTDRSAKSPASVASREKIIQGAVLGLAGPRKPITAVMPCTVIQPNDLAERFLDRTRRPEWQGKRAKLMEKFPDNMELWNQYREIRADSYRAGNNGKEATEFYASHRAEMDAGAIVAWTERYNPPQQLSAIQFAMDLWIDDPHAFAAEYQNEPLIQSNATLGRIKLESLDIMGRLSGLPYGVAPRGTQFITAGVDIQQRILYYLLTAWSEDFGGVVLDYGTYPKQHQPYFSGTNPPINLEALHPGMTLEPQVFRGLEELQGNVFNRKWLRDETQDTINVEGVLIDANWSLTSSAVYAFCKRNENSSVYYPSHGKGISAAQLPMDAWPKRPGTGEQCGDSWRLRQHSNSKISGRHLTYDTNFWKSRIAERLMVGQGAKNAITLWGDKTANHVHLSDHLSSEYSEPTAGRGREVDAWQTLSKVVENHWWDCLVMSAVIAAYKGIKLHVIAQNGKSAPAPQQTRRVAAPPPRR